jgi:hypothetical protein
MENPGTNLVLLVLDLANDVTHGCFKLLGYESISLMHLSQLFYKF